MSEGQIAKNACLLQAIGSGLVLEVADHVNVAASDTVTTSLKEVLFVVASVKSDAAAAASVAIVTAAPGATAGTIVIKSWEADGTAATDFGETITYIAIGRK